MKKRTQNKKGGRIGLKGKAVMVNAAKRGAMVGEKRADKILEAVPWNRMNILRSLRGGTTQSNVRWGTPHQHSDLVKEKALMAKLGYNIDKINSPKFQ
jgi:hypothetical protein